MARRRVRSLVTLRPKWSYPQTSQRFIKFRYIDNDFTGSTTALVPQTLYVFSGNSCYDPDATGVGVQPYWWDEHTELFNRYQVYASKITIYPTYVTPEAASTHPVKLMIVPFQNTVLLSTDPSDIMNMRNSQAMKFTSTYMDTDKRRKLTSYDSTRKMYAGIAQTSSFNASVTANPGLRWYWLVYFDTSTDAVNDYEIKFDVKIVYYTRLSQSGNVNES